tara:strand:- start:4156 stop:4668 length:513 start_codon:yes stop_codon:yes gene_type:complete
MSRKYGSFDVEIEYCDEDMKKTKTYTVSPLSQQELSNGWRLVLPKKKYINVTRKNDNNEDVVVRKTNESFFKINLAQLPAHLFYKLNDIYRKGEFSQYTARDKCYVYIVNPTPVDNEIKILFRFCQLYDNGIRQFTDEEKEKIRNSISIVNENEIKGWVIMRATRLFNNI